VSAVDVEALRRMYDEMARGNFWAAREVFDPEIEWEWSPRMEAITGRRTYRGISEVEASTRDWLATWDRFWVEAEDMTDLDGEVLVLTRQRGRARGSDVEVEIEAAEIWTMNAGVAVRYRSFDTREDAMRAAGLLN
jgi:ketosteroid isomerase-like protein